MLKLVRTLPKVLKYLPSDKARMRRNFMNSLQYWLGGSSDNLENFLLMISKAYVPELKDVEMESCRAGDVPGYRHLAPDRADHVSRTSRSTSTGTTPARTSSSRRTPRSSASSSSARTWSPATAGHYDGMVMDLEARGAKVVPIFAGGLDFSVPVERFFFDPITKGRYVDTVLVLDWFRPRRRPGAGKITRRRSSP